MKKATTIQDRLTDLIKELGLKPNSFANAIGTNAVNIYGAVNGRSQPSFELLQKTAIAFPHVNFVWLLTGNGPMFSENEAILPTNHEVAQKLKVLEEEIQKLKKDTKLAPTRSKQS